jgi:integrase
MGKLTALKVKAAKTAGSYQDGGGLMLIVKPTGSQSWQLRIQVNGKRRDFGLGSASGVSLADARQKAEELRRQYRLGLDPVAIKRAAKAEAEGIPTFEAAARQVHAEHKPGWRNAKHAAQWLSTLEEYAFPYIGQKPVGEIDGPEIRDLLAEIWLSKPETARRVRQRIGTVLDWAHAKGYRSAEAPMRSVSRGLPRQPKRDKHFAALPYEKLPAIMAELEATISIGRLALRFAILTACRSGEVRGATWAEIDFTRRIWTIPAGRMKAGKEHVVPLSDAAVEILRAAEPFRGRNKDAFIFPGKPGKPLSDMTLTKVLRDMGHTEITVHGFRSTFRDWAAEQTATPGDVVEAALAHTIRNKVEAAYRRTNYLEKRRGLMNEWGAFSGARRS